MYGNTIVLTKSERMELNQRGSSRSARADDACRVRVILLLETGHTRAAIRDKLDSLDRKDPVLPLSPARAE